MIYPNRYTIKKESLGIFLTYDGGDYVDKLLKFYEDNNQVDYNQFSKRNTKLNINQQDMRQMLNRKIQEEEGENSSSNKETNIHIDRKNTRFRSNKEKHLEELNLKTPTKQPRN